MHRFLIGSGVSVFYDLSAQRVTVEHNEKTVDHTWFSVYELLLLFACHLHATTEPAPGRRTRRQTTLAAQTTIGAFVAEVVANYRSRFGARIPNQIGTLLRPGEISKIRNILLTPNRPRTDLEPEAIDLDSRYLMTKDSDGKLVFNLKEWEELVFVSCVEVLAPMWQRINTPNKHEVPDRVRELPAARKLSQAMNPNWLGYITVWFVFSPYLWIRSWWRKTKLEWETAAIGQALRVGMQDACGLADQLAEQVRLAKAELERTREASAEVRATQEAGWHDVRLAEKQLGERDEGLNERERLLLAREAEIGKLLANLEAAKLRAEAYRQAANTARAAHGESPLP